MTTPRIAAYGLAAILSILAVLWGISEWRQRSGSSAEVQANIESGVASAHQSQAQAHDSKVEDLQALRKADQTNLGRVSAERDALLRKVAALQKPGADSAVGGSVGADHTDPSGNSGELELLRTTVAKDSEVIDSQNVVINSQSREIHELTLSRDEWKATAEAREKQALAQQAVTDAWKKAVTTSKWRGRAEGFVAGVALGYLGGKL